MYYLPLLLKIKSSYYCPTATGKKPCSHRRKHCESREGAVDAPAWRLADSFPLILSSHVTELIPTSVISRFHLLNGAQVPPCRNSVLLSRSTVLEYRPYPAAFRDNKVRTDLRYRTEAGPAAVDVLPHQMISSRGVRAAHESRRPYRRRWDSPFRPN